MTNNSELPMKIADSSVVDLSYYKEVKSYSDLFWNTSNLGDPIHDNKIEMLVAKEARLLDQQSFDEWLSLFLESGCYWIPGSSPAESPAEEVTLEFHDIRRLKDRIVRIQTGFAYSQIPISSTSRVTGIPEIWKVPGSSEGFLVRTSFIVFESRDGKSQVLSGWYGYVIIKDNDELKIKMKQINLNDCLSPQGNNSFFL